MCRAPVRLLVLCVALAVAADVPVLDRSDRPPGGVHTPSCSCRGPLCDAVRDLAIAVLERMAAEMPSVIRSHLNGTSDAHEFLRRYDAWLELADYASHTEPVPPRTACRWNNLSYTESGDPIEACEERERHLHEEIRETETALRLLLAKTTRAYMGYVLAAHGMGFVIKYANETRLQTGAEITGEDQPCDRGQYLWYLVLAAIFLEACDAIRQLVAHLCEETDTQTPPAEHGPTETAPVDAVAQADGADDEAADEEGEYEKLTGTVD